MDIKINPIKKKSNSKNLPLSGNNHKKLLNLRLEENVLVYNINVLLKIVFKLDSRLTSKLLIYNLKSFMELPNQSGGRSSIIHITYISYFIIINQHSVSFSSSAFGFYQSIYKSRKTIPNTFSACVFLISYLKNFKYIQKRIE